MKKILMLTAALAALPMLAQAQTSSTTSSTGQAISEQAASINQQFAAAPQNTSIETVPGLGTQIVSPTATCTIPVSIQGVILGGGLGGGTAYTVQYCKDLEISRQVDNEGDRADAQLMLCLLPEFRKVRALHATLDPQVQLCPPEFGTDGLTQAQQKAVDTRIEAVRKAQAQVVPVAVNPMAIERAQFCASLDPAKKEDRPYISQCMAH